MTEIDVVYLINKQSNHNNIELVYSLRSLEKYLKNYRDIYIIGELPDNFLINIKHYNIKDEFYKQQNIMQKIKFACNIVGLSENFIFFNDDHFLCKEVDANTYPYYFSTSKFNKIIVREETDVYRNITADTYKLLMQKNFNNYPKYFDIHTPIIYNKAEFIRIMELVNWDATKIGYLVKSLYCNTTKISLHIEELKDMKVNSPVKGKLKDYLANRNVFSIGDGAINEDFLNQMEEMYPNKSKHEIT